MKKKDRQIVMETTVQELKYETTGVCLWCLQPMEALQPGGLTARHVGSHIPAGQCEAALKRRKKQ